MPKVFISYVKENNSDVRRLVADLKGYGLDIWYDEDKLKPGVRWEDEIRDGIKNGDYFIACFSEEYNGRAKSYMNEELTQAIDQLRLRPTSQKWFIPVILSKTEIPSRSIGGGQTLSSIQWVSLYENWKLGIKQIISAIIPESDWIPTNITLPDGSIVIPLPLPPHNGVVHCLGKYPIINKQYKKFQESSVTPVAAPVGRNFNTYGWKGPFHPWAAEHFSSPDKPVVCVSLDDCNEYCKWATKLLEPEFGGSVVTLPSAQLWDFAAFGAKHLKRSKSHENQEVHSQSKAPASIDLSKKRENMFGISDMIGNIWEWCAEDPVYGDFAIREHYAPGKFAIQSLLGFSRPQPQRNAELRGGSFLDDVSRIELSLNSLKLRDGIMTSHSDLGFRVSARIPLEYLPKSLIQYYERIDNYRN